MASRRFHIDRNGRIVLVGLTADETLEFELLSMPQPTKSETSNLRGELRLLELQFKHHQATARENIGPDAANLWPYGIGASQSRQSLGKETVSQRTRTTLAATGVALIGATMMILLIIAAT